MAKREDKFNKNQEERDNLRKKTVCVNRVTKVVKGGRNMRFAALVVVGDGMGQCGYGMGKAAEVAEAIEKATQAAKKAMFSVPMFESTIPHTVTGIFGRGKVLLMPARDGTGVIAGGSVREVLEVLGIPDIRAKSLGSNNPINCVKATIDGLKSLRTAEQVAKLRGISADELI